MKKSYITLFALIAVLLTVLSPVAKAEEMASGSCGEDISWSFDGSTLTLTGSGAMEDGMPWEEYREDIQKVVVEGKITSIGAGAFQNCDNLTDVDFGGSMHTIGRQAFKSCDRLLMLELPKTFRVFDEECFMNCKMLSKIYFNGGMPSFRMNCLWDTYVDLIYPVNNPWPLEHVKQLEDAFQGRIEFKASDGSDPLEPESDEFASDVGEEVEPPEETEEVTEPATEATTVPTVPPTTEAPTEAPAEETEAETTEATEATEAPTEPETTEPAAAEDEEPAPEKGKRRSMGIWICLLIISGVLTFTIAGMLLVRRRRY